MSESNEQLSLDEAIGLINTAEADFLVRAALAGDERALRLVNAICDLGSDRGMRQDSGDEPDLLLDDAGFMMLQQKQGGES